MSPRYDYDCPTCGQRFELKQGFDSDPVAPCPECKTDSARVIRAPQVVYKTGGFYTSDKRNSGFGSYWNRKSEREDSGEPLPDISD